MSLMDESSPYLRREPRSELEAAQSTLQAARENYMMHEMTMGNWAVSGQMAADKDWIRAAEARVEELESRPEGA